MMIAFSVQGHGPVGPGDIALTALRIFGAGAAITIFYTAMSLGISSLTDRKAFASAGIILALLVTAAVSGALQANGSPTYALLDLFHLPFDLAGGDPRRAEQRRPAERRWPPWAPTLGVDAAVRRGRPASATPASR